jgi:hypothetical protein
MVMTPQILERILAHMENVMNNLAKEAIENMEIEENIKGIEDFIQNQFDIRLENLLGAKNSSIHHLESGMKNIVIQKKQKILEEIFNQHKS